MARGLCMMHYKRERTGRPLIDVGPQVGDVDGFGLYGILDDDGDTVGCHECGKRVVGLGNHAQVAHEMTARDYKRAHGLPLSRGLTPASARASRSTRARAQVGSPGWAALEAARDPLAAAAARDEDSFASTAARRDPDLPRRNGATRRRGPSRCPVCGQAWVPDPGTAVAVTCSPECWRQWQTRPAAHPRANADRDGEIYAQVQTLGRDAGEVAQAHGIGRDRVTQIVRSRQSDHPRARLRLARRLAARGATLQDIGDALGMTREGARQYLVREQIVRAPRVAATPPAPDEVGARFRAFLAEVVDYMDAHGHQPPESTPPGQWLAHKRRGGGAHVTAPRRAALADAGIDITKAPTNTSYAFRCSLCAARSRRAAPADQVRELRPNEIAQLVATGDDLQAWADTARQILTDPNVTLRSIADASGITTAGAHLRLGTHPASP